MISCPGIKRLRTFTTTFRRTCNDAPIQLFRIHPLTCQTYVAWVEDAKGNCQFKVFFRTTEKDATLIEPFLNSCSTHRSSFHTVNTDRLVGCRRVDELRGFLLVERARNTTGMQTSLDHCISFYEGYIPLVRFQLFDRQSVTTTNP